MPEPRHAQSYARAMGRACERGSAGAAIVALLMCWGFGRIAYAGVVRSVKGASRVCQHRAGRTIFHRDSVRVFAGPGMVYGCLKGSTREVGLWSTGPEQSGSVRDVVGRFVVVKWVMADQYTFDESLSVGNLGNGATYTIAWIDSPFPGTGSTTGDPATQLPWPMRKFALGSGGRTARLYYTYPAGAGSGSNPNPSGEVLDVIGFHHFKRTLATTGPNSIDPASVAYHGDTVTWTENGAGHSAQV